MDFNFPTSSFFRFQMDSAQKKSQLILAIQAIKKKPKLSIRRAATIYKMLYSTFNTHIHGIRARRDISPPCKNLTKLEKNTIIQRIIKLNSQACPPRLSAVKDMTNRLLRDCYATAKRPRRVTR
jgi:hypothetical protein